MQENDSHSQLSDLHAFAVHYYGHTTTMHATTTIMHAAQNKMILVGQKYQQEGGAILCYHLEKAPP